MSMAVMGLLAMTANAQNHDGHDGHQHTESSQHESNDKVNAEFQKQFTMVYETYINLEEAFVQSDAKKVSEQASVVEKQLNQVDAKLVEGGTNHSWVKQQALMKEGLKTMKESSDIQVQRMAFSKFGDALYVSIKEFGVTRMNAYLQYCPMALDNKGAYWLSTDKKIRNPYFGDMMLGCGSTKETVSEY